MFRAIDTSVKRKLWRHQAEAIDLAIAHFQTNETPYLIRMPTGTGKTGIIACLTMLSNEGSSLVLTPWANLRDQMIAHLHEQFWTTIRVPRLPISVDSIFPSTAKDKLGTKGRSVYVATFATLNELRRNDERMYNLLKKEISLVVVDEGHYEPAVEWGKSVKRLGRKTLLLTATPYRNDLKLFRITDPEHSVHHFTHQKAEQRNIIRKVDFGTFDCADSMEARSRAFAQLWRAAKANKQLPDKAPRAIICCKDHVQIQKVVLALRAERIAAIGIHERFQHIVDEREKDFLLHKVPNPHEVSEEVWVHQNKLTEGLDDHRFCFLALFTPIRNDRKLIQQIGRILRHSDDDRSTPSMVYFPAGDNSDPKRQWLAYRAFETELRLLSPQHFRDVVDTVIAKQPQVDYFDKHFRHRFDPTKLATDPQVIISPSVIVRRVIKDFSLTDYIQDCTDTLNLEDAVILGPDLNGPCQTSDSHAVWVYASVGNSNFLENRSLYEVRLETHCAMVAGGFLFISDSKGIYPIEYLEDYSLPAEIETLARYLDDRFTPTAVNLASTIPYDTSVRGSQHHGHNLLGVPASLIDRIQICRSIKGASTKYGRRYVGLTKSRLREEVTSAARNQFRPQVFMAWATAVAAILNSKIDSNSLFGRYMPTCPPPEKVVPKTLCLDFQAENSVLVHADETECTLSRACVDVHTVESDERTNHTATLWFKGAQDQSYHVVLTFEYQERKRRFWFKKSSGDPIHVKDPTDGENVEPKSMSQFLNQNQEIILVGLDGGEIVYQGRNFFKVDYSYAERSLLELIIDSAKVRKCQSEKGTQDQIKKLKSGRSVRFPNDSLFEAISSDKNFELPFIPELLICADLGTECADFIAANFTDKKFALIHAKSGDGAKLSASAFHEVVAQAMKNLAYLSPGREQPERAPSWERKACWNKTKVKIIQKLPAGYPTGVRLWEKIRRDIISGSNSELFVILVTTGAFSPKVLMEAIENKDSRTPQTAQLLHLLDGLNGHARQLGARVRLYNIPFKR